MRQFALLSVLALALSGCALFQKNPSSGPSSITGPSAPAPATEFAPTGGKTALGGPSVSAEALDKTTAEEKAAALAAPAKGGETELGRVVVALGPPAEQGIWLSTSLVTEKVQGRIATAAGKTLALELRPGTGGALLSLAGYQALGFTLTDLPEVTVFGP